MADMVVAGRLRQMRNGSVVAGLGVSGILSGMTDDCLVRPDGGCAASGHFGVVTALFGVDRALGRGSLRVLAGPAQFNGAGDRTVGPQVRIGLATNAVAHIAFGVMAHATLLPKHDGATLFAWGGGFGITYR